MKIHCISILLHKCNEFDDYLKEAERDKISAYKAQEQLKTKKKDNTVDLLEGLKELKKQKKVQEKLKKENEKAQKKQEKLDKEAQLKKEKEEQEKKME